MKVLIIGDQHIADSPPSSRRDSYRQDILDKMTWIIEYGNDVGVDCVLNLGDVFHIKSPNRNSHYLVQEVAHIFGDVSKAPMLIVPGNHDIRGSLNTIPTQPLGTLALHPNISLLMGGSEEFPIYGVPYVEPTPEDLEAWVEKYHADGGPDKYPLLSTHQAIFPEKEAPIYDYVSAEAWSSNFQAPYTAYGHIHSRMKAGAFYTIGSTHFCNNGAISRGSLHEETIHRQLAVTLFDDSADEVYTSVPIPFRPPEEVFKLDAVEVLKAQEVRVEGFLESLGSSELQFLTVEKILEDAKSRKHITPPMMGELEDIISSVI